MSIASNEMEESDSRIDEIEGFRCGKMLIVRIDKRRPWLCRGAAEENIFRMKFEQIQVSVKRDKRLVFRRKFKLVFLEVGIEEIGSEDLDDLDKLIGIIVTVEEGLFAEDLRKSEFVASKV